MNQTLLRKTTLSLAAVACLMVPRLYAQTTGVSHPELLNDNLNTNNDPATEDHYVPPSHSTTVAAPTTAATVPVPPNTTTTYTDVYVPYHPAGSAPAPVQTALVRHSDPTPVVTDDINSGVVTSVPVGPNELAAATVLKTTLQNDISTKDTLAGTPFSAVLVNDVGHDGRVLLPAGSVVHGRITQIHGGKRIGGAAAIRLQPDTITLPDGTNYRLDAQVIDLDHFEDSHVNSEGTIVGNTHPKATAGALGLTTTSAVVAGALIGGGVGAVVGLGVGAGAGAVWWLKHDREQLLPQGTEVVFDLNRPMSFGVAQ